MRLFFLLLIMSQSWTVVIRAGCPFLKDKFHSKFPVNTSATSINDSIYSPTTPVAKSFSSRSLKDVKVRPQLAKALATSYETLNQLAKSHIAFIEFKDLDAFFKREHESIPYPTWLTQLQRKAPKNPPQFGSVSSPVSLKKIGEGVRSEVYFFSTSKGNQKQNYYYRPLSPQLISIARKHLAAHTLNQLLSLEYAPITFMAIVNGKLGTVSQEVKGSSLSLETAKISGLEKDGVRAFEFLVGNIEAFNGNYLITKAQKVKVFDHDYAFIPGIMTEYANYMGHVPDKLPSNFLAKLKTLNPDLIKKELSPYLTHGELTSLIFRREVLLIYGALVN